MPKRVIRKARRGWKALVEFFFPWYDHHEQERRYARDVMHRKRAEQAIRRSKFDSYRDVHLP